MEWFSASRYLPEQMMLDALAEVAPDLAERHRREKSSKGAILRDVNARLQGMGNLRFALVVRVDGRCRRAQRVIAVLVEHVELPAPKDSAV